MSRIEMSSESESGKPQGSTAPQKRRCPEVKSQPVIHTSTSESEAEMPAEPVSVPLEKSVHTSESEEGTEDSEETQRIRAACEAFGKAQDCKGRKRKGKASTSLADHSPEARYTPRYEVSPVSSGVFDYARWCLEVVLTPAERAELASKAPITHGSFCAGMGTEDIALCAVRTALLELGGLAVEVTATFKAESDPHKLDFLRRKMGTKATTQFFKDNSDLADAHPRNWAGEESPRPNSKVWTIGIVCKDISALTTTPKSVSDPAGKSGKALAGMLQALQALRPENRPLLIVMECVRRLSDKRQVEEGGGTGTEAIVRRMAELGFVGSWHIVSPQAFHLPQSRSRVYGIFLKRDDFGTASAVKRKRDLSHAEAIIKRLQYGAPEPVKSVLSRLSLQPCKGRKGGKDRRGQGTLWQSQHKAFAHAAKLSAEECEPPEEFVSAAAGGLPERALKALWLKLVALGKKQSCDWKHDLIVVPRGMSITWMHPRLDIFPCVTPAEHFVIIQEGKFHDADGFALLAMQGVQDREVRSFALQNEPSKLLSDLAGNAFTANIIAVFLIAGILVM